MLCKDHIAKLVDEALAPDEDSNQALVQQTKQLGTELDAYLTSTLDSTSCVEAQADSCDEFPNQPAARVASECWHISLRFGPDALRNGMDPLSFLRYLETVGDINNLVTLYEELPSLETLDAESCYLGFEIDLKSETDKQTIEDVFEFVQDDCTIHILPPYSEIAHYVELIEQLPEETMRIGEILRQCGALTERELAEALGEQTSHLQEDDEDTSPTPRLGQVVVEQNIVDAPVVNAALDKQKTVAQNKEQDQKSVRVSASKLEGLINLVGELVIAGANSQLLATRTGEVKLIESIETMSRFVEDIRDTALGLRMVQIGETFNRYRRVVRELSRDMGKEVELVLSGGDTELDKTVVEKIADPLTHLVRNSIDHGIEPAAEREANGKNKKGRLHLNAFHDSGSIVVEVSDDGGGLPRDRILAKAQEVGLVSANQTLSDQEVFRLIFEPGFSTAEQVTNVSGRGVGMDVVRRNIEALRGQVDVHSTPSSGTGFSIRLPLTLAIIDGFLVRVGTRFYVVPLDLVVECIELDGRESNSHARSDYVNLRGEVMPFMRLSELFHPAGHHPPSAEQGRENIVVTRFAGVKTGLVVDELLGEYQTVIKPLGKVFQNLKGISGATILGSGEVAMILDVSALVHQVSGKRALATASTSQSALTH